MYLNYLMTSDAQVYCYSFYILVVNVVPIFHSYFYISHYFSGNYYSIYIC